MFWKGDRQDVLNRQGGFIAILLAAMIAFLLWALIFKKIPQGNGDVLLVLIGILSRDFATVVNFHFSSTSQQKKQIETIDTLAQTAKRAGEELAPIKSTPDLKLEPGQTATVKAEDDR